MIIIGCAHVAIYCARMVSIMITVTKSVLGRVRKYIQYYDRYVLTE